MLKLKTLFVAGLIPALALTQQDKFKQLSDEFATPNVYRNAAGAPGHQYYQQQANYVIQVTLDDAKQQIHGEETVTYINNSPDPLSYLWLQLDQNIQKPDSDKNLTQTGDIESMCLSLTNEYVRLQYFQDKSYREWEVSVRGIGVRLCGTQCSHREKDEPHLSSVDINQDHHRILIKCSANLGSACLDDYLLSTQSLILRLWRNCLGVFSLPYSEYHLNTKVKYN